MAVSAKDVMELRRQTDCGMMECKKALVKADGDINKAIEILREEGLATAAKKAGRIAAEGMVYAVATANGAVVVEVNAETDFVAKNDKFVEFTKDLANVVAEQKPADVEALMGCKMGEGTVDEALKALILVIKENIKVRRFAFYEGHCAAYVHGGGTHGVIAVPYKHLTLPTKRVVWISGVAGTLQNQHTTGSAPRAGLDSARNDESPT